MEIINILALPKDIKDKYSVKDNTFFKPELLDPKDSLDVEIGDSKVPDKFLPQVKLLKWDNECNFSLRLIDDEKGEPNIYGVGDKIIWEKGNILVEYYNVPQDEKGELKYKVAWSLKNKPKTNKIEFSIQYKELVFYYQPPLTEEERLSQEIYRPENVEGSYAVYHTSKTGNSTDPNAKNYCAGKAFHIYKPKITDAAGKSCWGILNIDTNTNIYSVEIPQEFLDKAVYPIRTNDTFGYYNGGTPGGTEEVISNPNGAYGSLFAGAAGTGVDIGVYWGIDGTPNSGVNIYTHSDGNQVTNAQKSLSLSTPDGWKTYTFASSPTLSAVDYVLGFASNDGKGSVANPFYDNGSANQGHSFIATVGIPASTLGTPSHNTNKYSIYCTYTPAGGGTTPTEDDPQVIVLSGIKKLIKKLTQKVLCFVGLL